MNVSVTMVIVIRIVLTLMDLSIVLVILDLLQL